MQQYAQGFFKDTSGKTKWVMKFVETPDSQKVDAWSRYCLVPEGSISLLERLRGALDHLQNATTNENMGETKRTAAKVEGPEEPPVEWKLNQSLVIWKNFWVAKLEEAIDHTAYNDQTAELKAKKPKMS